MKAKPTYCRDCGKKEIIQRTRCKECWAAWSRLRQKIIYAKKHNLKVPKTPKPKYCKDCGRKGINSFGRCKACAKIQYAIGYDFSLAKLTGYLQKRSWYKTYPFIVWKSKIHFALEMPKKFKIYQTYEKESSAEIIDKTNLELSKEEKRVMAFFELLLLDKAFELIKEGKIKNLDQLKNMFDSIQDFGNLLLYYSLLREQEKIDKPLNLDHVNLKHEEVLPDQTIYVAKCCGTCKHYRSLNVRKFIYHNEGLCTFGRANPKINILVSRIKEQPSIEEIKQTIKKLRTIYPSVHFLMDCDNYQKTTDKKRVRKLLQMIKNKQEQLIYAVDAK